MDKIVDEVGLDGINNIEIIENNVYNDEVNYIKVLDVDVQDHNKIVIED